MPDSVFGVKIFPELDQQGIATVTKAVRKALSQSIAIDKATADNFTKMASGAATKFNDLIGQARIHGLD